MLEGERTDHSPSTMEHAVPLQPQSIEKHYAAEAAIRTPQGWSNKWLEDLQPGDYWKRRCLGSLVMAVS
jgi:hypothetical protein